MTTGTESNAEFKYRDAVSLYADSGLSIKEICGQTGVGFSAFSTYLSKHRRDLILRRHNLTHLTDVRLRGKRGQTTVSHHRYADAIAACGSSEYIEYNISQIARIFDVDCSSLANQLRRHYPEIVPRREDERRRMGITVNLQYGARKWSKEAYANAVEMLRSTDMTIDEAADSCGVSRTGLRDHLLAYHPEMTSAREIRRSNATGKRVRGERTGNGSKHAPGRQTLEKYGKAIELYRTTSETIDDIVRIAGVSSGGFRHHLKMWHPELIAERRGYDRSADLSQTRRYRKSTAAKYAKAIEMMQSTEMPTARVASEFGLNSDTFRMYLKEHYPELAAMRGRKAQRDYTTT